MKGILVLGGDRPNQKIPSADIVVACDKGYEYCLEQGVTPDMVCGDFDSLGYIPKNARVFKAEKDFSDGEAGAEYLIEKGARCVEIYGGGGGRQDHYFGNITIMYKLLMAGITSVMLNNDHILYLTNSPITLKNTKGKIISLFTFSPISHITNSIGLKYKYDNFVLTKESNLGLSNVAEKDEVFIDILDGCVYIFVY